MGPNEKQNGSFLENREYQNQNQDTANENVVVKEEDEEDDDLEDEDLEDEDKNSANQSKENFNQTDNLFFGHPEEEYNEEDFQTEFSEDDPRRFSHFIV